MAYVFPELTTMGALFRFAAALEQAELDALTGAAQKTNPAQKAELERLLGKRRRRAEELERARREKLNETVLEPLMDMPEAPYVPELPEDLADLTAERLVQVALEIERKTILFYGAAIEKAGPVLAEVKRIFARFQKESEKSLKVLESL